MHNAAARNIKILIFRTLFTPHNFLHKNEHRPLRPPQRRRDWSLLLAGFSGRKTRVWRQEPLEASWPRRCPGPSTRDTPATPGTPRWCLATAWAAWGASQARGTLTGGRRRSKPPLSLDLRFLKYIFQLHAQTRASRGGDEGRDALRSLEWTHHRGLAWALGRNACLVR